GIKLRQISRIATRMLKHNKVNQKHIHDDFQVMVDLNAVSQDVIHSCFRSNVVLEEQQREKALLERLAKESAEANEPIKTPSLLLESENEGGRIHQESHVTTSDFLDTSSLISTSKTNRIYGFYYLM
ncbi:Mitochondrial carnitine/acylcarnitine carrier protein CACLlike, partial [Caligus rogercresseyi]